MSDVKITWAYLAGFLDGDGSIYNTVKKEGFHNVGVRFTQSENQAWVLVEIGLFLGQYDIHCEFRGYEPRGLSRQRSYHLTVRRHREIAFVLRSLRPHLVIKKQACDDLLEWLKDRPLSSREKTNCNQGHEFTPENTYKYRGSRHCRTCNRERTRAFRKRVR